MARRVEALGVTPAWVQVIANWCDDETIRPLVAANNPLREAWQLTGKFVVGYSGNLGRVHDFETVLAAAEQLHKEPRIVFLMIGGGKRFEDLVKSVKDHGLEGTFRFRPYARGERATICFERPRCALLSLMPRLEGLIVPSKFYGIAAAGKPIVMIGDGQGEIARLVRRYRCGIVIAAGDAAMLAETLRCWSNEPQIATEMGARAREMLDAQFNRRRALDQWTRLIGRVDLARSDDIDTS